MKETHAHKILKLLWDGRYHSVNELNHGLHISQYNARVWDLRQKGFDIENLMYREIEVKNRHLIQKYDGKITDNLTFFRLLTPTKNIDYETLELIKTDENQLKLFS